MSTPSAKAQLPPKRAQFLLSGTQKVHTYESSGGLITAQFARHNLSLIPPLPQNAVVHDSACGSGTVSRLLLANGNPQNITIRATDIDEPFLAVLKSDAEKNGWPIEVSNQRSESIDIPDSTFDLSIINLAIFFTPNEGRAGAKEIYRTLKPGGTAVVNCWELITWLKPVIAAHEHIRPGVPMPMPVTPWHDGQHIQKVMKEAGFKEESMRVERSEAWGEVEREGLRGWVEKIWAYMGGFGGWYEGDEENWEQALDKMVEELLVQPGTEVVDGKVRMKGSQWVVIANK